jgi:hypothetical protein
LTRGAQRLLGNYTHNTQQPNNVTNNEQQTKENKRANSRMQVKLSASILGFLKRQLECV